jgi:N-acetylneuraminic acid mutarotase
MSGQPRINGGENDMNNTRRDLLKWLCVPFLVCGLPSGSVSAEGAWTKKADMPTPRAGIHSNTVGDRIYVIGGDQFIAGSVPSGLVEVYDPSTDSWTRKADMPTARGFFGTAVVAGRIYAIGGSPNMNEHDPGIAVVEVYDPATDTWTRKADMPTPRLHLTSAVVGGKIYVFGGSPEWAVPLAATEAYDPATDMWTKLADMPTPRTGIWAAALNGKIYVVGGIAWENEALATVEEYDPATDSWRSMADVPTPRFLLPVEAVGDEVYAIGGSTSDYTTLKAVEAFKP